MEYVRPDYAKNYELFQQWIRETIRHAGRYCYTEDVQKAINLLEGEIAFFEEAASGAVFSAEKRVLSRLRKGSKDLKKSLEGRL